MHVATAVLARPPREVLDRLTRYAASGALVVVASGWQAVAGIPLMGRSVAGRRLEGLLVDGEVSGGDRRLIRQMLGEDVVPVVFTRGGPAAALKANWIWLTPDRVVVLPCELTSGT